MKTVEEVINDIEICQKYFTCTLCPYCGNNECKSKWGRDALFYLKWLLQKIKQPLSNELLMWDDMIDDLINRQEAIDMIEKWLTIAKHYCNESKYNCGEIDAYETALYEIKNLPSIEQKYNKSHHKLVKVENVEPIFNCEYKNCYESGICGTCGETVYDRQKYCNNCGSELNWE